VQNEHWQERTCNSLAGFVENSVALIAPQWQLPWNADDSAIAPRSFA
jgi:hypothetical protein